MTGHDWTSSKMSGGTFPCQADGHPPPPFRGGEVSGLSGVLDVEKKEHAGKKNSDHRKSFRGSLAWKQENYSGAPTSAALKIAVAASEGRDNRTTKLLVYCKHLVP